MTHNEILSIYRQKPPTRSETWRQYCNSHGIPVTDSNVVFLMVFCPILIVSEMAKISLKREWSE